MIIIYFFLIYLFSSLNAMEGDKEIPLLKYCLFVKSKNIKALKNKKMFFNLHSDIQNDIKKMIPYDQFHLWFEKQYFQYKANINSACFNKNGTLILATSDNTAFIWDIHTEKELHRFQHNDYVNAACFNKNETQILTTSNDLIARIWNINTGKESQRFKHKSAYSFSSLKSACFNENETQILTLGEGIAYIWCVNTGKKLQCFKESRIQLACFTKNETQILTILNHDIVYIWNINTGNISHSFQLIKSSGGSYHNLSVCFNKNGTQILITSNDDIARLWDVNTIKTLQCFQHNDFVRSTCFNKNETLILTTGNSTVCIWDINTGKKLYCLKHFNNDNLITRFFFNKYVISACFNTDETQILTTLSDKTVCIWQRYTTWTLDQLLLCTLLFTWLKVQKPDKSINSIEAFIQTTRIYDEIDSENVKQIIDSFTSAVKAAIWNKMILFIQKYGK